MCLYEPVRATATLAGSAQAYGDRERERDCTRAAKRGGGGSKRGVFLIWTCPSFFVLFFVRFSRFSENFPICSGMVRIFSRTCPFPRWSELPPSPENIQGGFGSSSLKECIELLNATIYNSPAPLDSGVGRKATVPSHHQATRLGVDWASNDWAVWLYCNACDCLGALWPLMPGWAAWARKNEPNIFGVKQSLLVLYKAIPDMQELLLTNLIILIQLESLSHPLSFTSLSLLEKGVFWKKSIL